LSGSWRHASRRARCIKILVAERPPVRNVRRRGHLIDTRPHVSQRIDPVFQARQIAKALVLLCLSVWRPSYWSLGCTRANRNKHDDRSPQPP
jgi:hypothetical protein